jgi:hypothetical protein
MRIAREIDVTSTYTEMSERAGATGLRKLPIEAIATESR